MNKNICLIVGSLDIGGLQRVVLSLAQVFSELGNKVVVIALSNDKKVSFPLDECKFDIYAIKRRRNPIRGIQDMENAKSLQNKITEIGMNFDLVISNAFETNRICRKSNIPNTCYCFHGTVSAIVNEKTGFSRFRRKIQYLLLIKNTR
jgi:short-subunit dehydrogenase involved in D-alanine esterification of teichoic acids